MCQQMRLNLLNCIHRHRHHDQHRCAAKVKRYGELTAQNFRQQAHQRQITGPEHKNTVHHIIKVILRALAGADAGNETILVFQILRHFLGLEGNVGCVEIRKEHDQRCEKQQIQRLTGAKIRQDCRHHRPGLCTRKGRDGGWQQQQRRRKNRRNNARRVDLDRQMRRSAIINLHPHLTARILDMYLAQRPLHEHHKGNHGDHHDNHPKDHRGRNGARPALAEELRNGGGNFSDNAGKDDQRYTIADAARSDLFAQPHQEHGATDQRHHTSEPEIQPRIMRQIARLDADSNAPSLKHRQKHCAVTGVLVQLLAALIAFFLQLFKLRHHRRQQLHDDRRRDIGHDPQRKNAHPADRTTGEHVQNAADARARIFHELAQLGAINAGNRNVGAKTVDHQQTNGEKYPLAKIGGLAKRAPR